MIAQTPVEHGATVLSAPFGQMHVNPGDEADHAIMRSRQLAGLLALMSDADESDAMVRLAARLGAGVAETIRRALCDGTQDLGAIAPQTREIAGVLIASQPSAGPSDMLWLAQQLADELVDTVAGVLDAGGAA
jgi:hypothetical protein